MVECKGSYKEPVERDSVHGAGSCPVCGRRFAHRALAGLELRLSTDWRKQGGRIPLHSPDNYRKFCVEWISRSPRA